ncbi:MAG: mycofactocin system GMC family oxidoreductase MftG [Gordonia sp. (in: high G+C Gram-positive bacteria)]|uniref:mycofactocin system GMC family oxidoreductase MftG n=1 Tax=Gordonia TaxID=2053 RepID=UPI0032635C08
MSGTAAFAVADVVVVGAGSAGCVVAERLSREPSRRVALLEAGPGSLPDAAVTALTRLPIEPGAPRVRRHPEVRGRDVVRGAGLGGSSAVNGGYFLRGHRDDYREWPWPAAELEAAFDVLDGGAAGGGLMSVSAFDDADLGTVAVAFEEYWRPRAPVGSGPWPTVGLNRVRSNRRDGRRFTAAEAFLSSPRPNLRVIGGCPAAEVTVRAGRVRGVVTDRGRIDAETVVLTAGTLGTAALAAPVLGGVLPVHEHAERLVRFRPRGSVAAPALLQTVLHTDDRLEIRCYGDDFAAFIASVPTSGVALGVADMGAGTAGSLRWDGRLRIDLGEPDAASSSRLAGGVDEVRRLLESSDFAHLVVPGSVRVDEMTGASSHAWGSLPAGRAVGADGAVPGITGLHVADASVLPGPLRSGPHASVMAVATVIAERLAD